MKSTDTIDKRIQLDIKVINDIVHEVRNKPNLKMLVFGLGYDSKLWFKELGKNVYFVEHDKKYVNLNNTIPQKNIIEYGYRNINVYDSLKRVQNTSYIESYKMPTELAKVGPFDIILIDGPLGYSSNTPGRLLPMYWAKHRLSKADTLIYVDDIKRPLESKCYDAYFSQLSTEIFQERGGCAKIRIP